VFFEPLGDAVDGGVGTYGNVCYVATVEAMDYFGDGESGWHDNNVIHYSFGTGMPSRTLPRGAIKRWMPWRWPVWLLDEAMVEASDNSVRFTLRHYGKRLDFRRYQPSLEDDVVRGELGVEIPPGLSSNNLKLGSSSPQEIKLMKDIGTAYSNGVDFDKSGEELTANPPPGSDGAPYPSRLPALTEQGIRDLFAGKAT
jgi:hypothetical protein